MILLAHENWKPFNVTSVCGPFSHAILQFHKQTVTSQLNGHWLSPQDNQFQLTHEMLNSYQRYMYSTQLHYCLKQLFILIDGGGGDAQYHKILAAVYEGRLIRIIRTKKVNSNKKNISNETPTLFSNV